MTIGEKIKKLRLDLNLTQEELANAVHTTKQTIYKYETGIVSNIPASKIKLLADKLQTTPADLMGWDETFSSSPAVLQTNGVMSRGVFVDINQKLKNRRLELNLTMLEVAKKVGVSEATISRWESGDIANMRRDKISLLANALKVSPSFIMGWDEPDYEWMKEHGEYPYNPKIKKIPVLGYVSAGLPIYAEEHIEGYTYTEVENDGFEYFALKVTGHSMNAARINDGDIVIVRVQPTCENGDIVVVRVDNEDATVKRFNRLGNIVQLIPQSFNPEYQIQEYDLRKTKIDIIGKVVECKIKF